MRCGSTVNTVVFGNVASRMAAGRAAPGFYQHRSTGRRGPSDGDLPDDRIARFPGRRASNRLQARAEPEDVRVASLLENRDEPMASSNRIGRAAWEVLVTLCGNAYLVVGTLVLSSLVLLVWPWSRDGTWGQAIGRAWARSLVWISGVRLRVEGTSRPGDGAICIYMPNHQSQLDIPVLMATLPGRVRFLAKRSLLKIPIFGWSLRSLGFVPVDREDRSHAQDMLEVARQRLAAGISLVVFPEGTRGDGVRLLPFQRGGFLLALRSGSPIVPVGIEGTAQVRPRGSLRLRPGPVTVRYGDPVDMEGLTIRDRRRLVAEVEQQVAQLSGVGRPVRTVKGAPGEGSS